MGMPHPLQYLLAKLCGLPVVHYCVHLIGWLRRHIGQLQLVHRWCEQRGQTLQMYLEHLESGSPADGLEVLLTSIALDLNINIVQEDVVWSTSREGLDFSDPTIIVAMAGALPHKYKDPGSGTQADIDTSKTSDSVEKPVQIPDGLQNRLKGGHPLVMAPDTMDSTSAETSETMDTNPDDELMVDHAVKQ